MSQHQLTPLTLSTFIPEFLFDREFKNRSKSTIRYYRLELQYFSNWLSEKRITEFSSSIIKGYLMDLSSHRNKGGVHSSYRAIRCFFNWYDFEYEPEWKNPMRKVNLQKGNIEPLPEITLEEVQKLIDVCKGKHKYKQIAILKVLVDTGLRASELLALTIEDVDFENGQVTVRHGKGDKFRTVWLGDKGRKAVKLYLKSREDLTEASPLFTNEDDQFLGYEGLREIIKRLCKRANVHYKGVHSFRRCFALTLYRKGIDILSISRLLGHSDLEVTKRYLNINNEDLKEAHSKASPADSLD